MVFRTMRHLRCLWLQFFAWLEFVVVSHTHLLKYMPNPLLTGLWTARRQKPENPKHEVIAIRVLRAAPSAPSFRFATAPKPHTAQKKPPARHVKAEPAAVLSLIVGEIVRFISLYQVFQVAFSGHQPRDRLLLQKCRPLCLQTNRHAVALQA